MNQKNKCIDGGVVRLSIVVKSVINIIETI